MVLQHTHPRRPEICPSSAGGYELPSWSLTSVVLPSDLIPDAEAWTSILVVTPPSEVHSCCQCIVSSLFSTLCARFFHRPRYGGVVVFLVIVSPFYCFCYSPWTVYFPVPRGTPYWRPVTDGTWIGQPTTDGPFLSHLLTLFTLCIMPRFFVLCARSFPPEAVDTRSINFSYSNMCCV